MLFRSLQFGRELRNRAHLHRGHPPSQTLATRLDSIRSGEIRVRLVARVLPMLTALPGVRRSAQRRAHVLSGGASADTAAFPGRRRRAATWPSPGAWICIRRRRTGLTAPLSARGPPPSAFDHAACGRAVWAGLLLLRPTIPQIQPVQCFFFFPEVYSLSQIICFWHFALAIEM